MAKRASCHYEVAHVPKGKASIFLRPTGRTKAHARRILRSYARRPNTRRAVLAVVCKVGGRRKVKLQERCMPDRWGDLTCERRVKGRWRRM